MTLRRITWWASMALLTALVAATAPAFPQETENVGSDAPAATAPSSQAVDLTAGTASYAGTITGIDPRLGIVTFRQVVDDPRRIKPYRDVKKSLVALDNEESIR